MKPNIGINEKELVEIVNILKVVLADEYLLYTKTRNYHWNVVGPNFQELHKFFESQYDQLDESIDEIAERIRSLGMYSPGSLQAFIKLSTLKEDEIEGIKSSKMIENLLKDHESIIINLRKEIPIIGDKLGDVGTSDFLTALLETHEKMAWMLRSFLA